MNKLRPDLPPLPKRIRQLPIDERGYPVPWFVVWLDERDRPTNRGKGRPDFRMICPGAIPQAIRDNLCWVCGQPMGGIKVAVIGPMCAITRTTSEPPSHRECAEFSAMACPFLTKPQMVRREDEFTEAHKNNVSGEMIRRNPGVCALWAMKSYTRFSDAKGGLLFKVGDPLWVQWYAMGKLATRIQVLAAIESGLPILQQACGGRPRDLLELGITVGEFMKLNLLPPAVGELTKS